MPDIHLTDFLRDKLAKNAVKMHIAIGGCFRDGVMFHADDPEEDENTVFDDFFCLMLCEIC